MLGAAMPTRSPSNRRQVKRAREALVISVLIPAGLSIDALFAWPGQLAIDLVTWLVFVWIFSSSAPQRRRAMALCLIFATAGELVLSIIWGLYDYQLGNLPLFVPAGHVLLFLLGQWLAAAWQRCGLSRCLLYLPHALAIPWLSFILTTGKDELSLLFFALYFIATYASLQHRSLQHRSLQHKPLTQQSDVTPARYADPRLFAVMFVLALLMELIGTGLGNWTWRAEVPGLGLSATNPPLAVGSLYVVLDRLVMLASPRPKSSAGSERFDQ